MREVPKPVRHHPVARLATCLEGQPHLVPVVYVCVEGAVYIPIDGKPKSGKKLKRLANIERNPKVSLLVDHYESDWSRLWWFRLDGTATTAATPPSVVTALREKYPQYQQTSVGEECIRITPTVTRHWSSTP